MKIRSIGAAGALVGIALGTHLLLGAQDASVSVWAGVYTNGQAKRGQAAYNEQCASCHGDQLTGGESAPALAGSEFLSNWNGLSAGELFERIRKTMPANSPGKLSRETTADLLAYIFSVNQFPAGRPELPPNAEMLKSIRIDANKPAQK